MTLGYHTIGHGPEKVMFLHGWLSDHLVFEPLFPFLDPDRYTVVFADYRGYGLSSGQEGDYSIKEIATDVIGLAKELAWDHCHIAGHSMAGMVLQKVAFLAPELVLSGIAITPVSASGLPLDEDTAAFFRSAADDDDALAALFNTLTGERHSREFLKYMALRTRKATSREALLGYMKAWTTTDFSADVADLRTKVLVIAGAHDMAVGPDVMNSTYLQQLPNTEMEIIDGAGHYPTQETPVELFTIIEKHLVSMAET